MTIPENTADGKKLWNGTTIRSLIIPVEQEPEFWSKVDKSSECWNWTGATWKGYGSFYVRDRIAHGRHLLAHRVAYALTKGQIPGDMTVDHVCRNRSCVNPNHLQLLSNEENLLRGEGICAKNARKQYCIRGHPLFGENLKIKRSPDGTVLGRSCRACDRLDVLRRRGKI